MKFKSELGPFNNQLAETIFKEKYYHTGAETWETLCKTLVQEVCGEHMSKDDCSQLTQYMSKMSFIPGGRYLYYNPIVTGKQIGRAHV